MNRLIVGLLVGMLSAAPLRAAAAEPYEINVILSLSGIAAFIGTQEAASLRALEAVENKNGGINGRPIKFVIVDDASSPVNAVQLANQIIAKNVPVLLGSDAHGRLRCGLLDRENLRAGRILLLARAAPGAGILRLLGRRFDLRPQPRGDAIFSRARLDAHRADLLDRRLRSGRRERRARQFGAAGKQEPLARGERALQHCRRERRRATRAHQGGRPASDHRLDDRHADRARSCAALHDAGLDVPVLLNAGNIVRAQLRGYASFAPTQLFLPGFRFMAPDLVRSGPLKEAQQAFFAGLAAQNITTPEVNMSFSWDPGRVVINVLRHLPPNPTAAQVKDAIEATHGISGINSLLDYRDVQPARRADRRGRRHSLGRRQRHVRAGEPAGRVAAQEVSDAMKVLITGGMGVIGAEATRKFVQEGHRPVIYARRRDESLIGDILDRVDIELGDITDAARLTDVLQTHAITHIVHAAGYVSAPAAANVPLGIQVNVMGTTNVLEAARQLGIARVVYTSAKGVYGPFLGRGRLSRRTSPITEDHPKTSVSHLRLRETDGREHVSVLQRDVRRRRRDPALRHDVRSGENRSATAIMGVTSQIIEAPAARQTVRPQARRRRKRRLHLQQRFGAGHLPRDRRAEAREPRVQHRLGHRAAR